MKQDYANILDEDIVKDTITFASLFLLNYECLKDYICENMRDYLSSEYSLNEESGELEILESQVYKDELKRLCAKSKLRASVLWFKDIGAMNQEDVDLFFLARKKRNYITHELEQVLAQGATEEDAQLFVSLVELYRKLDKWWINNIEIPTSPDNIPGDYDYDSVVGGQALFLSVVNDVALGNGDSYKKILGEIKKQ